MLRRSFLRLAEAAPALLRHPTFAAGAKPNIVLMYADDVGYGDLSCYGASRVKTPNLDRLALRGVRFTDAHSSSATCTSSRYSLGGEPQFLPELRTGRSKPLAACSGA